MLSHFPQQQSVYCCIE
uniref:Uncharacterized protein n=1 Tax=Rhizophora mucronata TaxID=61149 RepID=A0A2P2R3F3_RHIMU